MAGYRARSLVQSDVRATSNDCDGVASSRALWKGADRYQAHPTPVVGEDPVDPDTAPFTHL